MSCGSPPDNQNDSKSSNTHLLEPLKHYALLTYDLCSCKLDNGPDADLIPRKSVATTWAIEPPAATVEGTTALPWAVCAMRGGGDISPVLEIKRLVWSLTPLSVFLNKSGLKCGSEVHQPQTVGRGGPIGCQMSNGPL